MSFGDGLMLVDSSQVAAPDIAVNAAAADIISYVIPVKCQLEIWGVNITATFAVHAVKPVVKLQRVPNITGVAVDIESITLGSSNTNLKKGDGTSALKTVIVADTDLLIGNVVYNARSKEFVQFAPGDVLRFRHATAAGEVGGSYRPFAILRVAREDATQTKTWMVDA